MLYHQVSGLHLISVQQYTYNAYQGIYNIAVNAGVWTSKAA